MNTQNLSILVEKAGAWPVRDGAHEALRLTVPALIGSRPLAPVVAAFHEQYPAVALELRISSSTGVRLLPLPRAAFRRRGAACQVFCAGSHYLRKHGAPATVDGLASHACIAVGRNHWEIEDAAGQLRPVSAGGWLRGDTLEFALHCALEGLGIARLPLFLVANELWSGQLVPVLPDCRLPELALEVVHASCGPVPPSAVALMDILLEQLASETDGTPRSREACSRHDAA